MFEDLILSILKSRVQEVNVHQNNVSTCCFNLVLLQYEPEHKIELFVKAEELEVNPAIVSLLMSEVAASLDEIMLGKVNCYWFVDSLVHV